MDRKFYSDGEQIRLRSECAVALFELLELRCVNKGLSVMQWKVLGWTLLDPVLSVRQQLLAVMSRVFHSFAVHPRFLAYPCLFANDEHLSGAARKEFSLALRRLRALHKLVCEKAVIEGDDNTMRLAQDNMPEMVFPYVLHLLSNHPNFPSSARMESEEDKQGLKIIARCVKFSTSVLLDSLDDENVSNLSYLFKQVHMISQYYFDRTDPTNLGLHFVAQLTAKLLLEKIRTVENVQAYPGDIHLPMDLYCANDEEGKVAEIAKRERQRALRDADTVVEQVLRGTGATASHSSSHGHTKRSATAGRSAAIAMMSPKRHPTAAVKASPVRAEEPTRQSSRARKDVSYKEKEELDSEVQQWENDAAASQSTASARSTKSATATQVSS